MNWKELGIDSNWSLFLDRDGVLNRRIPEGYVRKPEELLVLTGVYEALHLLSSIFKRIVVVSNQQGIGKGLMTEKELSEVHHRLLNKLSFHGGRIDKIYYCPELAESGSLNRKPESGMALQAQIDFPEIQFEKAIMVGDSASDMEFGSRLGMQLVLINGKYGELEKCETLQIPFIYGSLLEFAEDLIQSQPIDQEPEESFLEGL